MVTVTATAPDRADGHQRNLDNPGAGRRAGDRSGELAQQIPVVRHHRLIGRPDGGTRTQGVSGVSSSPSGSRAFIVILPVTRLT